ncbi:probable WRKY transcription factor 53 [Solanum dulcamara]|uniref:probable WRKY transcription factor 53 n=1 Tax=Solanum dulcamara TaxID=45834 RepID=UPI0024867E80|nr:probable WRKY transcription factor 53 [Solanum dulcamara]
MGGVFTWDYYSLINELTQGMEHTKQLRTYLSSVASTSEAFPNLLLQKILSSFEQSLLILKWTGSPVQSLPAAGAIELMVSGDGNPRSDDKKRSFEDHQKLIHISKRRKSQERRRIVSGVESALDDGYCWRKYGQKDIPGANFPRGYYRCKSRFIENCWATKQMQRSDVDPTVVEITYIGYHTCQCHQITNSTLQATSPEKQANHHSLIDGDYSPYFVSGEGGFDSFEGPIDGGYSWRKYGQKDILGAKYPRSYYICTYLNIQNCRATKEVQMSDDDPTTLNIIYKGSHLVT